jgi:hypothetical protein
LRKFSVQEKRVRRKLACQRPGDLTGGLEGAVTKRGGTTKGAVSARRAGGHPEGLCGVEENSFPVPGSGEAVPVLYDESWGRVLPSTGGMRCVPCGAGRRGGHGMENPRTKTIFWNCAAVIDAPPFWRPRPGRSGEGDCGTHRKGAPARPLLRQVGTRHNGASGTGWASGAGGEMPVAEAARRWACRADGSEALRTCSGEKTENRVGRIPKVWEWEEYRSSIFVFRRERVISRAGERGKKVGKASRLQTPERC